ncbi:hypothetical protein LguiB_003151 [Lonicera macranthoides]
MEKEIHQWKWRMRETGGRDGDDGNNSGDGSLKLEHGNREKNGNKNIPFFYDPITIFVFRCVLVGHGSLPGFLHPTKNSTSLKTILTSTCEGIDSAQTIVLKSNLKNKKSVPLKIQLDTKANVPTGKSATTTTTSNAMCKVGLRIKIWKWTV